MIYCSHCGTQNRDGSKFCSNCAARLAPPSGLVCPMCSTANSAENVFCSNCGARLVPLTGGTGASQRDSAPPIKGLSLPAKPAAPPSAEEKKSEDVSITKDNIDDWLTKLRESPPVEDEIAPAPPAKTPPASPPAKEYLNLGQEVQAPVEQTPPVPGEGEKADAKAENEAIPSDTIREVPNWLRDLGAERRSPSAAAPTDDEIASLPPTSDEELPTWLQPSSTEKIELVESSPSASSRERHQEPEQPLTPASLAESEEIEPARMEEIPLWIDMLKPAEDQSSAPPIPLQPHTEAPPVEIEPARAEEIPLWIAKLKPAEDQSSALPLQPQAEAPLVEIEPARAEEIPLWIAKLKPAEDQPQTLPLPPPPPPLVEATHPALEPARAEEIPPWIAELKPTEDEPPATTVEPEVQADDLAEWLRLPKLEPGVSIGAQEVAGEPAEVDGPLASLRGVIPLALAIAQAHPDAPGVLTEQKDGAHLFEEILAEPQAQIPRVSRRRERRLLSTMRPLIYVFLAFAVILPLFMPPNLSGSLLQISGTSAAEFHDVIQSLPSNSTVLVAFDYDPSLSGEMDLVARAILRDLIQRRINIVALSTVEPGPLIAQRVLADVTANVKDYRYGTNFLNIGFLPGHESGIAQLAAQGIPTSSRDFDQNQVVGQYPIAANLKNIKNVPMVIELAGTEETLRMWVEQFPSRSNARIAAGTSAAVEPKARAYRDARQLVALSSGAVGAAEYEILSNQQGQAVRLVTAQSIGQIALIMVVLFGNVVFWISRMVEKG